MIWTFEPWLFYLLLSIVILAVAFLTGWLLHSVLKKRDKHQKVLERAASLGLAVVMGLVYLYTANVFTDRASEGERVLTAGESERVHTTQAVVVPFGDYAVLERLYDYGYSVEDEIDGDLYTLTFTITDEEALVNEYNDYITGNGVFSNRARLDFRQIYESEWKPQIENDTQAASGTELPAVRVDITAESE
ncbi:hypothetical protein SAMN05192534_11863 [Alteribacillus persepolensis]|uniref:Uncharacterized protein n=1 Tax=Alteribacillus persepolensis TaxID=568899 RepID=A0A1G8H5G4_9BACI|nr:hypothetical protein [Alteribacillus persepolensis]SDI01907.1 hypothetical protein SAMN05192534_11863 [Alteribacillus persepolensis]